MRGLLKVSLFRFLIEINLVPSEVPYSTNKKLVDYQSVFWLDSNICNITEHWNKTLENILSNCVMPLGGELIILSRFFYAQETKFLEGNFMHIKIKVRAKNCSSIFLDRKVSSLSLQKYFRIHNENIPVEKFEWRNKKC